MNWIDGVSKTLSSAEHLSSRPSTEDGDPGELQAIRLDHSWIHQLQATGAGEAGARSSAG